MKLSGLDHEGKISSWLRACSAMLETIKQHSTRTMDMLGQMECAHYIATGNDAELIELIERDDKYAEAQLSALKDYIQSNQFIADTQAHLADRGETINTLEMSQPMQPVELDNGVPRFRPNYIVRFIMGTSEFQWEHLAQNFNAVDFSHFMQLCGYTVESYSGHALAIREHVEQANINAAGLKSKDSQ